MTTKTIYFGAYSATDLEDMGIESALVHNGTSYEFRLDMYLEDGFIRITDSIGRMIPLDVTHYQELAKAMEMVTSLQRLQDYRNQVDEVLNDGRTTIGLQFDAEMDEFIVN